MPRVRVLHVTEAYGGGVATAIEQYRRYPDAEHDLLACLRRDLAHSELPHWGTIHTQHLAWARSWLRGRGRGYDVVHAHSTIAGLLVRCAAPAVPVVYSPHALAASHHPRRLVRCGMQILEAGLRRRTSVFAAVSSAEELLLERLTRGKPAVFVPHALEVEHQRRTRAERINRVVSVGRLNSQKNPELVAQLPDLFREYDGSMEWVWIGDGDVGRKRLLLRNGWKVLGWLSREEVREYVATSMAVLHPARYEGMPMAVLEAMAVGTPVLAFDIEPMRQLTSVTRFRTRSQAVRALHELVAHRESWERQVLRSREEVVRHFSRRAQDDALRKLYELAST